MGNNIDTLNSHLESLENVIDRFQNHSIFRSGCDTVRVRSNSAPNNISYSAPPYEILRAEYRHSLGGSPRRNILRTSFATIPEEDIVSNIVNFM